MANIDNINNLRDNRKNSKSLDKDLNSRKHNMKISNTYFKKSADVPRIAVY